MIKNPFSSISGALRANLDVILVVASILGWILSFGGIFALMAGQDWGFPCSLTGILILVVSGWLGDGLV